MQRRSTLVTTRGGSRKLYVGSRFVPKELHALPIPGLFEKVEQSSVRQLEYPSFVIVSIVEMTVA